jgi:DNA uptake protein ComE-like DNA-binding protein
MNRISRLISGSLLIALMMSVVACGGNESNEQEEVQETSTSQTTIEQGTTATAPEAKLNINTASGEEFRTIPNVGDKMVHEFEEYRPYVSIQQFRKEIGKYVDEDQVAAYEEYIFVPVDVNNSDAATLQQLPGVDADAAQELIDARPYESNEAFLEDLASHVNEEELTTAKTYLKSE